MITVPAVTTAPPSVHTLTPGGLDWLEVKFAKLAKRAAKFGVPAPTIEVIDRQVVIGEDGFVKEFIKVALVGEIPRYSGWRLVALIDRDLSAPDAPNVIRLLPGEVLDPEWRWLADVCDHCGHVPRGRKTLIVVHHDTHGERIVGSTCLHDFLGTTSLDWLVGWADTVTGLKDLADEASRFGHRDNKVEPVAYLTTVVAVIRDFGWVPRSSEGITPTADRAWRLLRARSVEGSVKPTADDAEWAARALDWALSLPLEPTRKDGTLDDYLANVRAVAARPAWGEKDIGLGASIAAAYRRVVERAANEFRTAAEEAEAHAVPAPIGRHEVIAEVIRTGTRDSFDGRGVRYVFTVKVKTDDGGAWRGWLTIPRDLVDAGVACGDKVRLTATWKRSDNDASFAFGSRPAGTLIERAGPL